MLDKLKFKIDGGDVLIILILKILLGFLVNEGINLVVYYILIL